MKQQFNAKLSPALLELERAFDSFNASLFQGTLKQRPVITIQSKGKRNAMGWFWANRWKDTNGGENVVPEINISAEYLKAQDMLQPLETLIHEMVHLSNWKQGVQDCSRSGNYHNKHFKAEAELAGLIVEKVGNHGFAFTKLGDKARKAVETHKPDFEAFSVFRREEVGKKKPKKRLKKWACECTSFWGDTNKTYQVKCEECGTEFIES